jgi:excisionase family DNA binding protein
MSHLLEQQILEIKEFIVKQTLVNKEIMSLSEAAIYMNISKSLLYKKTCGRKITFYRPGAKIIFFKRADLDAWMLSKKESSIGELSIIPNQRKKGGITIQ